MNLRMHHHQRSLHERFPIPRPQPQGGPDLVMGPGGQVSLVSVPGAASTTPVPSVSQTSQQPTSTPNTTNPLSSRPPPSSSPSQDTINQSISPTSAVAVATSSTASAVPSASLTTETLSVTTAASVTSSSIIVSTSIVTPASTTSSTLSTTSTSASTSSAPSTSSTTPTSSTPSTSSVSATSALGLAVPNTASSSSATASARTTDLASAASNHRGTPFIVGVILAVIVLIAFATALIAWLIRFRNQRKRRSEGPDVPWAKSEDADDALENGPRSSVVTGLGIRDADVAYNTAWDAIGDRDVGEPKRSESYDPTSPTKRSAAPSLDPFSDAYPEMSTSLQESVAFPMPISHGPYPGTIPPHVMESPYPGAIPPHVLARGSPSVDIHGSAATLGPLQVANMMPGDQSVASSRAPTALGMVGGVDSVSPRPKEYGTPREMGRPRFLSLDGEGLKVPWKLSASILPASARIKGQGAGGNWDHVPPLPLPGDLEEGQGRGEDTNEGWTAALKANLSHAFGTASPTAPNTRGEGAASDAQDNFTTLPTMRASGPRDIADTNYEYFVGGEMIGEPVTREDSATSEPWSLQDNGDGSGMVHIHGSGLDAYGGGDHAFSPQVSRSTIALSDSDASRDDLTRIVTYESTAPLVKKPTNGLLRPGLPTRLSRYAKDIGYRAGVLSPGNVYSTMADPTRPNFDDAPQIPCMPVMPVSRTSTVSVGSPYGRGAGRRSTKRRPKNVKRVSSSFSVASHASESSRQTGMESLNEREEAARRAMKERRMRMKARSRNAHVQLDDDSSA